MPRAGFNLDFTFKKQIVIDQAYANTDLSRCVRIRKGKYKGNRDIERPENGTVRRFQRDGAGRPLATALKD
jgi:hypothetical protein